MYSGSFSPHITIPTRITPRSSTLIDNIFTDTVNESLVSGNVTDYLAQFLIYPELTINNKENTIKEKSFYIKDSKYMEIFFHTHKKVKKSITNCTSRK